MSEQKKFWLLLGLFVLSLCLLAYLNYAGKDLFIGN
jgi:hypothetical protein